MVEPVVGSVQFAIAFGSAWAWPKRAWKPSPMTRPSRAITQPTRGLGSTRPRPATARRIARRSRASSALVHIRQHLLLLFRIGRERIVAPQHRVDEHPADARAEEAVGDVEDPGEHIRRR